VLSNPFPSVSPVGMAFILPGRMAGYQLPDCAPTPWFLEEEYVKWNLRLKFILFLLLCVNAGRRESERKSTCTCVVRFGLLP